MAIEELVSTKHSLVDLTESLANWSAGGPLPDNVLCWARDVDQSTSLVAAPRSVSEQENLLAQQKRADHQLVLEVTRGTEGNRARVGIILLNGRKITREISLVENTLTEKFAVYDGSTPVDTTSWREVHSIETNPERKKILRIDCSDGPTAGDVLVTMATPDQVAYYAFQQIPSRTIKDANKAIIGERPYPALHFWDYLVAQPLSVHIERFPISASQSVSACILASLPGGLPVHAELSPELLALYEEIFRHRTMNMLPSSKTHLA